MCVMWLSYGSLFSSNLLLLTGAGSCGLCLCPIIVIQKHFSQRYAFPMGMHMCISSIGGVVGAPLLEILSTHYGWRGALVIVSAVVMNTVACGLIYRESDPTDDDEATRVCPSSSNLIKDSLMMCKSIETDDDETTPLCPRSSNSIKHNLIVCNPVETCPAEDGEAKPLCPKSSNSIKHNLIKCKPSETCSKDNNIATQASYTDKYAGKGILAYTNWGQERNCNKDRDGNLTYNDPKCNNNDDSKDILDGNGYDAFTQSSEEKQINKSGWLACHINNYQLLLQPVFICYLLSRLLTRASGVVMSQYAPSKALADGSSEMEASLLRSICSVMIMLGRMVSTFINSFDHVNRYVFGCVTMLLNAVFSLGFSLPHKYLFNLISMPSISLCSGEYNNDTVWPVWEGAMMQLVKLPAWKVGVRGFVPHSGNKLKD